MAPVSEATPLDRRPTVIVADALELRRAGVIGLMRDWSASHGVELRSVDTALAHEPGEEACALVVLNLGFQSIALAHVQDWLAALKRRLPDAPLVVMSDREEAEEVVIAFRGGAHGFIPTSTRPDLALQALSFIMKGGSFFPPGTLLHLPRRRQEGAGKGGRQPPRIALVHVRGNCARSRGSTAGARVVPRPSALPHGADRRA